MAEQTPKTDHLDGHDGTVPRRTVIQGAAWSLPVIAVAAAVPVQASSVNTYAIESRFGAGWYPDTPNVPPPGQAGGSGTLRFDAAVPDKYFRVTGTSAGDVISSIYLDVLLSDGWPAPTFTALAGSNPSWTALTATGATQVLNGVTYNAYRSDYAGAVVATGATTDVPLSFYFGALSPYYLDQTIQVTRHVTVNGTPVTFAGGPTLIVNTNATLSQAPKP